MMPIKSTVIALILLMGLPILAAEKPVAPSDSTIGIVVDGVVIVRLPIVLVPFKNSFSVSAPEFIKGMKSVFRPETREWMEVNQDNGLITNQILRRLNIYHLYNSETKNIELSIPVSLRRLSKSDWQLPKAAPSEAVNAIDSESTVRAPPSQKPPAPDTVIASTTPQTITHVYRATENKEDLFQEIFKRKAPALPDKIDVNLIVDDQPKGSIWIRFSDNRTKFHFPADPILDVVRGRLNTRVMTRLEGSLQEGKFLDIPILRECGIEATFDEKAFQLSLRLPANILGVQYHELTGSGLDILPLKTIAPNLFSAFLNMRFMERISYFENAASAEDSTNLGRSIAESMNKKHRQPVVADLNGAINMAGVVLEGEGLYQEELDTRSHVFTRRNFRFVYDQPNYALRYSLGDITFPTAAYQGFVPMGGVGVARDFSLKPGLTAYPVKDYEFFLENPAEIRIYINGNLVSALQLDPGTHDLRNFPFSNGESNVKIEITDLTGRIQEFTFNWIQEPSILARGLSEFTFNAGYPSHGEDYAKSHASSGNFQPVMGYVYDLDNPTGTFLYSRGVTDQLTLGAYGQAISGHGLAGIQMRQAIPLGKMQWDIASTMGSDSTLGYALKIDWAYLSKPKGTNARLGWRTQVEYRTPGFKREAFGLTDDKQAFAFSTSAQLPNPIFNVSANGDYQLKYQGRNTYSASLGIGKMLAYGISSALSLRHIMAKDGIPNTSISANLSYALYTGSHGLIAGERLTSHPKPIEVERDAKAWDNYTDLRWDYNSSAPFPVNPNGMAYASFGPASNEYASRLGLRGNQGLSEIYLRRIEPAAGTNSPLHQNFADISAEAAFVYVDGTLTLSRPIANSFLVVKGVESHKKNEMKLNPSPVGYDAKGTEYLPAVLPSLNAYIPKSVGLDPGEPPLWAPPIKTSYYLMPTYKSGFSLLIGSPPTILVMGQLLDNAGNPVKSRSFKVQLKNKSLEPQLAFTNSTGRFQLPPLVSGDYNVILDEDRTPGSLNVPSTAKGVYRVGAIRMPD